MTNFLHSGIVMSAVRFQTFCIEFYSRHIQKPSPAVYATFSKTGLLDMLKPDREDRHGMGVEAWRQFSAGHSVRLK